MATDGDGRGERVDSWLALGAELIVRATQGICAGSLLNAAAGSADTRARLEEWRDVLPLFESDRDRLTA